MRVILEADVQFSAGRAKGDVAALVSGRMNVGKLGLSGDRSVRPVYPGAFLARVHPPPTRTMTSTLIHRLKLTLLALALPSLLGSGLSAQSGSFTNFGVSCRNDVALRAPSTPRLGQPFQVSYVGPYDPNFVGPRNFSYQPYLLTGASNTSFGGATLPLRFPTAITGGLTTCSLLVSADIVTPLPVVPNVPPLHSLTLTIPGTPALLGASFFQQWLLVTTTFDMRTNQTTVTVASSNAGHGVIGI